MEEITLHSGYSDTFTMDCTESMSNVGSTQIKYYLNFKALNKGSKIKSDYELTMMPYKNILRSYDSGRQQAARGAKLARQQ